MLCMPCLYLPQSSQSDFRLRSPSLLWCFRRGAHTKGSFSRWIHQRLCETRDSRKKRRKEKKKKQFGNISGRTDQKHSNEFRLVMHEISPWTKEEFNKAAKLLIKHVGGDGAFVSLSAAEPSLKCEEGLRQFLWEIKFSLYRLIIIVIIMVIIIIIYSKN